MQLRKNYYIEAMAIGAVRLKQGISYAQMKLKLEDQLGVFQPGAEAAFLNWFNESFTTSQMSDMAI